MYVHVYAHVHVYVLVIPSMCMYTSYTEHVYVESAEYSDSPLQIFREEQNEVHWNYH